MGPTYALDHQSTIYITRTDIQLQTSKPLSKASVGICKYGTEIKAIKNTSKKATQHT